MNLREPSTSIIPVLHDRAVHSSHLAALLILERSLRRCLAHLKWPCSPQPSRYLWPLSLSIAPASEAGTLLLFLALWGSGMRLCKPCLEPHTRQAQARPSSHHLVSICHVASLVRSMSCRVQLLSSRYVHLLCFWSNIVCQLFR